MARSRSQQLQAQVEELQEEASLQENRSHGDASLLSELETADYGVSKEKVDLKFSKKKRSLADILIKSLHPLAKRHPRYIVIKVDEQA